MSFRWTKKNRLLGGWVGTLTDRIAEGGERAPETKKPAGLGRALKIFAPTVGGLVSLEGG